MACCPAGSSACWRHSGRGSVIAMDAASWRRHSRLWARPAILKGWTRATPPAAGTVGGAARRRVVHVPQATVDLHPSGMRKDSIVATSTDFMILRDGRPLVSVAWDDVMQVRAYKRDELTTDLICLDVVLRNGTTWCVHEEE